MHLNTLTVHLHELIRNQFLGHHYMIDVSISMLSVPIDNLPWYYFHKHHYQIEAYYLFTQDYWEKWSAFDEMRSHFRGSCLLFACSQKQPNCVLSHMWIIITTIHLLHFLCQFPKLKKYHVEIYSAPPRIFSVGFQHHHGNFQSARMVEPAGRVFGARLWEAQVEHIWNNGLVKKKRNTLPACMCQQCPF